MDEPVSKLIELSIINRIKIALEDALENCQELLADHDERLGRTTKKNENTAKFYEAQIAEIRQIIELLPVVIC